MAFYRSRPSLGRLALGWVTCLPPLKRWAIIGRPYGA
jgi:hypothetical protein